MTGIIDAASDVMRELERVIQKGTDASVKLLILIFVIIPLSGALAGVVFNTMSKTYEDVPGAQGLIGGAQTAYDVIGTLQDGYDILLIIYPVIIVFAAFVGAVIVFFDKIRDWVDDHFG